MENNLQLNFAPLHEFVSQWESGHIAEVLDAALYVYACSLADTRNSALPDPAEALDGLYILRGLRDRMQQIGHG